MLSCHPLLAISLLVLLTSNNYIVANIQQHEVLDNSFPRVFDMDLRNSTNRGVIEALEHRKFTIGTCQIKITQSQVQDMNENLTRQPRPPFSLRYQFQYMVACSGQGVEERVCLIGGSLSSTDAPSLPPNLINVSLMIHNLRGKSDGCSVSGKTLIEVHEALARHMGAKAIVLLDASKIQVFRGDDSLRIRSTLFYALMHPNQRHQLTSYYSQFGFSFVFTSDRDHFRANEAVRQLHSLNLPDLSSRIDSSHYYGKMLKSMLLSYHSKKEVGLNLLTDLIQFVCGGDGRGRWNCQMIIERLLLLPYQNLLPENDVETALSEIIYSIEMARIMIKHLK